MHPKFWCLNFKQQYFLNYSSPTNNLYSVRQKSITAFKSIVKLLGLGQFLREVLRWHAASPHWLRTLRQNFARVVSLATVQLVRKHAMDPLTFSCPQYYKVAT